MSWSQPKLHNGTPVPHLIGKRVRTMTDDGEINEPRISDGRGGSWIWREGYTHVVSYQVWTPDTEANKQREKETDLSTLSKQATQGKWYPRTYRGRQNKVYGAVDTDTHLGIAESTDASDTQFITALVNAYRSGAVVEAGWQDISTAPKDGTDILACAEGWDGHSIVRWQNGVWLGVCDGELSIRAQGDCYTDYHQPFITHWKPLPTPPAQEQSE